MYVPIEFAAPDPAAAWEAVTAAPFGLLIAPVDGKPAVTHLPFLVSRSAGGEPALAGHVARQNPHAKAIAAGAGVLCVFNGPHAYVSPNWYGAPGVPTWNYLAVHVSGTARPMGDAALEELLRDLSAVHEGAGPGAWTPDRLEEESFAALRKAITGFTVEVSAVEAKFKLSQNRPADDRARVIAKYRDAATPDTLALAALMENLSAV
jgi:transcriptional regulator